jgi:hypothetical protein
MLAGYVSATDWKKHRRMIGIYRLAIKHNVYFTLSEHWELRYLPVPISAIWPERFALCHEQHSLRSPDLRMIETALCKLDEYLAKTKPTLVP